MWQSSKGGTPCNWNSGGQGGRAHGYSCSRPTPCSFPGGAGCPRARLGINRVGTVCKVCREYTSGGCCWCEQGWLSHPLWGMSLGRRRLAFTPFLGDAHPLTKSCSTWKCFTAIITAKSYMAKFLTFINNIECRNHVTLTKGKF